MSSEANKQPIVLISCVKTKRDKPCKAQDMYTSDLFKKSLSYARSLQPKQIFILSAKYGLLPLDQEINPYEKTLNNMGVKERKAWAQEVLNSLRARTDLENDEFVILAGKVYSEYVVPNLTNYREPLEGLIIGWRKHWLDENTNV